MDLKIQCFICDLDITSMTFADREAHEMHGLSEKEHLVATAVFFSDKCDHFCCGLPPKVCFVKNLTEELDKDFSFRREEE